MTKEVIQTSDEFGLIFSILTELGQRLPQLTGNPLYESSIPHYLSSGAYKFITAGPASGGLEEQRAFGFVTFYPAPLLKNGIVLAVEAFWFEDDDLDSQLPVWSFLADLARKMDFQGTCIARGSTNTPASLEALVKRGQLGGDPILPDVVGLMPSVGGLYSAFAEEALSPELFLASCIRIYPQELLGFFAGAASARDAVFYRGEGRLVNEPHWRCRNLEELADLFMERGFPARAPGIFAGSVQEQILQQGYVNQPTVSLSKSFRVAADYATHNGQRGGLVFTIDGNRLRQQGHVFDAYATMVHHCEPMFDGDDLRTLSEAVRTLQPLKAGRFLERCNEEAMTNAVRRGGMRREPEAIDWREYIGRDERNLLSPTGIGDDDLSRLVQALESFWMMAVTPVGLAISLAVTSDGAVEEEALRLGYIIAFRQVQERLEAALAGREEDYRQHGWDLTPFGYIAKNCRDEEAFSSGPVPGECVVEVVPVTGLSG
jgi:hypothetical protein